MFIVSSRYIIFLEHFNYHIQFFGNILLKFLASLFTVKYSKKFSDDMDGMLQGYQFMHDMRVSVFKKKKKYNFIKPYFFFSAGTVGRVIEISKISVAYFMTSYNVIIFLFFSPPISGVKLFRYLLVRSILAENLHLGATYFKALSVRMHYWLYIKYASSCE